MCIAWVLTLTNRCRADGYDPTNPRYMQLSIGFWEVYSREKWSWRDQLWWPYFVKMYDIQPSTFPPDLKGMFVNNYDLRGHSGHTYTSKNDQDAVAARP